MGHLRVVRDGARCARGPRRRRHRRGDAQHPRRTRARSAQGARAPALMSNPFEWLRAMARRGDDDDDDLLAEAAYALGGLGDEPAGLVVAARRLLAHHRRHGGLWWVASHVLCATDPVSRARTCRELLDDDRTVARLAGALPFQEEGEQLAVAGWSDAVQAALDERP